MNKLKKLIQQKEKIEEQIREIEEERKYKIDVIIDILDSSSEEMQGTIIKQILGGGRELLDIIENILKEYDEEKLQNLYREITEDSINRIEIENKKHL